MNLKEKESKLTTALLGVLLFALGTAFGLNWPGIVRSLAQ